MIDELEYFNNKRANKTYISRKIAPTGSDGQAGRPLRIASKVFDSKESHSFAMENAEVVLHVSPGGRQEVIAKFLEDDRKIFLLVIQRFLKASGRPQQISFSFSGEELAKLLRFLGNLKEIQFPDDEKINITDVELQRLLSAGQLQSLLAENQDAVVQLLRSEITKSDLVALGYRKQQLERFHNLLFDDAFFLAERRLLGASEEGVWQAFFESNKWIFGYGLTYLFMSSLDEKKLEQMVVGNDIFGKGKRTDAILKSRGAVEALCFVEIKKHTTELLEGGDPYRPACWAPSYELTGGVVQSQVTVEMTMKKIVGKFEPTDSKGNPTGEQIFSYHPRSLLVVGSLRQFHTASGINIEKYRSFELYRRHMTRPEVITFDELYERAKFIVDNADQ